MTLFQFYKEFDTEKKCIDYLIKIRWNDKLSCPKCGCEKYYIIKAYSTKKGKGLFPRFKCANNKCYYRYTVTTGTIFHACNVPLHHFFYMIYSSAMNKKNVSSVQNGTNLGIMQKTCWYIMMRIRSLCYQDDKLKLSNTVEVDEAYVAHGRWGNCASGRKVPVLGLMERGGKVIVKVIHKKDKKTVQDVILKHVETGSNVYTDGAACYFNLSNYFMHDSVNHKIQQWVKGNVHTNSIESFWSQVKKAIVSTHGSVSIQHLQSYCDELAYRWNTRDLTPVERFNDLLKRGCVSKPKGNRDVVLKVRYIKQGAANDFIEDQELKLSKKMVKGIVSCYKKQNTGRHLDSKDANGSFGYLVERGMLVSRKNIWSLSKKALEIGRILS